MSEYAGSAMYLAWIHAGGTETLQADSRSFTWAPVLNFIDATAGSDTYENLLTSYGTGSEFSCETLAQASGTLAASLDRGTQGTVEYGPEGNDAGKIKYSIPCTASGPNWSSPFGDVTVLTANWRQTAAETRGTFS